jgi:integral membrane protein
VTKLFLTYRVLALVVGVLLLIGATEMVLEYLVPDDTAAARFGKNLEWVWEVHGLIYMVYLVVAFILVQKVKWPLSQFLLMLVAGLIPGLIFWVEHRVVVTMREQHPELQNA